MPLKCPWNWDVYLKEDTCLQCLNETGGKFIFNTVLRLCIAVIGHCCFATFGFVCSNRFMYTANSH